MSWYGFNLEYERGWLKRLAWDLYAW